MGLSFLNKKSWHTGSFKNMEAVWQAREKQAEMQRKKEEIKKKVIEEKYSEELKRIQVDAGLLPASALDRMSWMYDPLDNPEARNNAEAYLLGKTVKSLSEVQGLKGTLQEQSEDARTQNDEFLKLHEDPLFMIKKEQEKRKEDFRKNPVNMQDLFNDAKAIIEARKARQLAESKDKKSKKSKKDKKEKKKRRRSSSSPSRSSSSSSEDRDSKHKKKHSKRGSKNKKSKDEKERKHRKDSRSSSASSSNSSDSSRDRRRADKKHKKDKNRGEAEQKPLKKDSDSDGEEVFAEYLQKRLGPLVEFDREQYRLKFKAKYLFKDNVRSNKPMTAEEKDAELQRMKENALKHEQTKMSQYARDTAAEKESTPVGVGFLNTVHKNALLGEKADGLADNLKRGAFFQDRRALAD